MKALKISTAGVIEHIDIQATDSLATLQSAVGGYIEILGLARGVDLVINEEGKFAGLEHNTLADMLVRSYGLALRPGDFIVGDVVIKGTDTQGATAELGAAEVARIEAVGAALAAALKP